MIMNLHKVYSFVLIAVCNGFTVADDKFAVSGSTVQLKCPFKGSTTTANPTWILWSKKDGKTVTLYSEGPNLAFNLDSDIKLRLQVTGDSGAGEYHLNISDVRMSDQGTYQCELSGNSGDGSTQQLTVIVGPSAITIDNVTPDDKIPGIEGRDMTIKCTAEGGQPAPDLKLLVLGTTYSGTKSVQHTFQPIYDDDGSPVSCQAGYNQINYYPLKSSANIYLMFKPIVTPLASENLSTEEAQPVDVTCKSTGSRPAASMYWLLGQELTNITGNSTYVSNQESQEKTFTVTSNLKYRVDRKYNGQNLTCGAFNIAGKMERSYTLNVKYAPVVTVENKTFLHADSSRKIHSSLDSNPPVNTCTWRHTSKYGEYIRHFSDNNQILTLPTVPEDQRYQDTGKYVCTAGNGITGINGQLKQTGSGYVISEAPPVVTADNKNNTTQYGKFGYSTRLNVNVYSIPKYSSIRWYKGNTHLVLNKYASKEETAKVTDVFYGIEVQLDGYRVTLTISNLQKADFTNYTLRLYYGSQYVQYEVTLESASAPETPSNFTITGSGETSITVQWIPGFNGGQKQTFYIEYRINGTITWIPNEIKTSNLLDSHNFYTLSGLQDKTSYELRMYARNKFNQSQHTDIETIITLGKEKITALGGVIGGITGGLVALVAILAFIVFVVCKRKKDSGFRKKRTRSQSDSEIEEGLKDNILYDGSEPDGLKVNVLYQSAGPDSINRGLNTEYAEVSKPSKKPSESTNKEYAEVRKQNDVYAEVDKKTQQKNVKMKKQKDKKKFPKSEKTKGTAFNNNPAGGYANPGTSMKNISDGVYSNAEDQSAGNKKTAQGLEYADLTFGSQITKGKKSIIHGDENKTIYSEVDHTKKAPPPPQESEYEETDIRHGKK